MTMIMMMMIHSPGVDPAHAWLPGKVKTPARDLVITHNSGTWNVKTAKINLDKYRQTRTTTSLSRCLLLVLSLCWV